MEKSPKDQKTEHVSNKSGRLAAGLKKFTGRAALGKAVEAKKGFVGDAYDIELVRQGLPERAKLTKGQSRNIGSIETHLL